MSKEKKSYFFDFSFRKSSMNLIKESGINLESVPLKSFCNEIKKGDWNKVLQKKQ